MAPVAEEKILILYLITKISKVPFPSKIYEIYFSCLCLCGFFFRGFTSKIVKVPIPSIKLYQNILFMHVCVFVSLRGFILKKLKVPFPSKLYENILFMCVSVFSCFFHFFFRVFVGKNYRGHSLVNYMKVYNSCVFLFFSLFF